jgi:ribonucleotide monophosphatase NagD (HAD superfamily)
LLFVTNDSRSSRTWYSAKLHRLGVVADESDTLTSAATASYIATHEDTGGRSAFVIGTRELKAEIEGAGLAVAEGESGRDASLVIVGAHEGFDYHELRVASHAVRTGSCLRMSPTLMAM